MADHHHHTRLLSVGSHFSTFPSPSAPGVNETECQLFEDTAPLDDTIVCHSSGDDTQVLDLTDEEEVVLDSEDEEVCSRKWFDNRKLESNDTHRVVGNKRCEATSEQMDTLKCVNHGVVKLDYIGSQEPGQRTQDNALEFVDQLLSVQSMDLCPDIGVKKAAKSVFSPASGVTGPLVLAKRLGNKTSVLKTDIFEWADDDQLGKDAVISRKMGAHLQSESRRQMVTHLDCKEPCSNSDNVLQEKEYFLDLNKKPGNSSQLDLRSSKHSPEETNLISSIKGYNEDLSAESLEQQLKTSSQDKEATLDMNDIGLDTQIAAEAMEALLHGPDADCATFSADQGSTKAAKDFHISVITGETQVEHTSIQKSSCFGSGGILRKSSGGKLFARKNSKISNRQKPDACNSEFAMMTREKRSKSLVTDQCHGTNANVRSGRKPHSIIMQSLVDRTIELNHQCQNDINPSISAEHIWLCKEQRGGEHKLSATHETIPSTTSGISMRPSNNASSMNTNGEVGSISGGPSQITPDGFVTYRRKRSQLVADTGTSVDDGERCSKSHCNSGGPSQITPDDIITYRRKRSPLVADTCTSVDDGERCSKSHCNSSSESSRTNNLLSKEQTLQDISARDCCLEAHIRSHPKRKRTMRGQKFAKTDFEFMTSKEGSASLSRITYLGEFDRLEEFMQSDKKGVVDSVLHDNAAEKNHKLIVSSNNNMEIPCSGNGTAGINIRGAGRVSSYKMPLKDYKRLHNKNKPKASLLKELISLGVSASIPDLSWKALRRRRDVTCIKILFSQHLHDDVIKQQKKISARLGISIAKCLTDATHFIADRFVRTRNMLEAIALAKHVVTPLWLESCREASCLVDEKNYVLRDIKKEKEIGFSMAVSLTRASHHPLLQGRRVFISPNIQPHKEMISSLVKLVHGQVVESDQIPAVENQENQHDLVILSCEQDHKMCIPFLNQGVPIYSSELLLNGIVIQTLEFERYQLFVDHSKRKQSRKGFRKSGKFL